MEANHQIVCLNMTVKKEAPVLLHSVYQPLPSSKPKGRSR
jgi:hypothetical protein